MKPWLIIFLFLHQVIFAQNNVALFDFPTTSSEGDVNVNSILTTSFELVNGMIFVEANMNQQQGNFILDTGAPLTIVNTQTPNHKSELTANGISEAFMVTSTEIKSFEWAGIKRSQFEALAIDISHLEKASERPILGLIGYDLLKNYELLIDYENQEIRLFNARKNNWHVNHQPIETFSFIIQDHLPVLKVKIGRKNYYFGLDTGAAVNLIDLSQKDKIAKDLRSDLKIEEIQGVDKVVHEVFATTIYETKVKDLAFDNMKYLFTDISHLKESSSLRIDGLLGFPFFSQKKCSINYQKRKIYIW